MMEGKSIAEEALKLAKDIQRISDFDTPNAEDKRPSMEGTRYYAPSPPRRPEIDERIT